MHGQNPPCICLQQIAALCPMKIEAREDIRDIFSIFHDGGIAAASIQANTLVLDIEIQYLAERVKPEYKGFKIYLYGFSDVEFSTWPSDLKSAPEKIRDIQSIFSPELEVLEANLKENSIEVVCNQHSSAYDYCGGELSFQVDSAAVQDESGKFYTIDELDILCKDYWDEWASKNE